MITKKIPIFHMNKIKYNLRYIINVIKAVKHVVLKGIRQKITAYNVKIIIGRSQQLKIYTQKKIIVMKIALLIIILIQAMNIFVLQNVQIIIIN